MKGIVICIVGTILVLIFARPTQWAHMFNPPNRLPVDKVQSYCRLLTGSVPGGVPVLVFGSSRSPETGLLWAELQKRGIMFRGVDVMENPQAAPIMNQIGHQAVPTTIVGTCVIEGVDPEGIKNAYYSEQQSQKWPASSLPSQSLPQGPRGNTGRHRAKPAQHNNLSKSQHK